jgi:hypothetical protein
MMIRLMKNILMFIAGITSVAIVANRDVYAEMPFGIPKANTNIDVLVPLDVAQKIAFTIAQRKGQIGMGPVLPCVDDDGDIVAYMFPFVIGSTSFPSYSDIASQIQYGRNIMKNGFKAMNDADKESVLTAIQIKMQKMNNLPNSPIVNQNMAIQEAEARKVGQKKMVGADQFGTVVISARYDRFPVPLYMSYLHPYFYHGDLATTAASKISSSGIVTLERIYFLENSRTQYFEFSSDKGNILLNAFSLDNESADRVLYMKGKKETPVPAIMSLISQEWAKYNRLIQ